ncbi:MAG: UTRA domain-containing protein [Firmicutes bacterium]|nr:UTRA domain-containing protein [Bacillota bacterium]
MGGAHLNRQTHASRLEEGSGTSRPGGVPAVNGTEGLLDRLAAAEETDGLVRGRRYTPKGILHQAEHWIETASRVAAEKDRLLELFAQAGILPFGGPGKVILAGSGGTALAGVCCEGLLRTRLGVDVDALATTDLVVGADGLLRRGVPHLMVSLARSGESPESVGAIVAAENAAPGIRHVVLTCNGDGSLARLLSSREQDAAVIVVDPPTRDRGVALTGSFTNLVVACQALGFVQDPAVYQAYVRAMAAHAGQVLQGYQKTLEQVASRDIRRVVFLGAGGLLGVARESARSMQELTDNRVLAAAETFMGLRHSPAAAIDDTTLVVYFVSSENPRRTYELELIEQHARLGQGLFRLAVGYDSGAELAGLVDALIRLEPVDGGPLPDALRPPVDMIVGQLLGIFQSVHLGLAPDDPSRQGFISRAMWAGAVRRPASPGQTPAEATDQAEPRAGRGRVATAPDAAQARAADLMAQVHREAPEPLYRQVRKMVLDKILSGEWPPETRIPSEREIAEQFGISRLTARQAINDLVAQRVLRRHQGKGTFVTGTNPEPAGPRSFGFTESILRKGLWPRTVLVSAEAVRASPREAESLAVDAGETLRKVVRVRLASDEPVVLETVFLPERLVPGLTAEEIGNRPVEDILQDRCGIRIWHFRETLEPAQVSGEEAGLLGVTAGSLAVLVERVGYGPGGEAVELARLLVRGDRCRQFLEWTR